MIDKRMRIWAVDYPGRRKEGSVRDLGLEQSGFAVDYPLTDYQPVRRPDDGYLTALFDTASARCDRPDVVIGYCTASVLAHGLSRLVEKHTGIRPATVIIEGRTPTDDLVVESVRASLLQVEIDEARADELCSAALADLHQKPGSSLLRIEDALRDAVRRTLADDGIPAAESELIIEQLIARHLRWLTHLVGALEAAQETPAAPILRLSSNGSQLPAELSTAAVDATLAVGVSPEDLLKSNDVSQGIARWLRLTRSHS